MTDEEIKLAIAKAEQVIKEALDEELAKRYNRTPNSKIGVLRHYFSNVHGIWGDLGKVPNEAMYGIFVRYLEGNPDLADISIVDIVDDSYKGKTTAAWFQAVKDQINVSTQYGCHLEEVGEMLDQTAFDPVLQVLVNDLREQLTDVADYLKTGRGLDGVKSRVELLDALLDQRVTGTGLAVVLNMNIEDAVREVDYSNFSKFEDGVVLTAPGGKVKKGEYFVKPKLDRYV